jgi:hypothetical protein
MTYKTKLQIFIQKIMPKIVHIFWYDLKLKSFFKVKIDFHHFKKITYIQQWSKHNMWCIKATKGIYLTTSCTKKIIHKCFIWIIKKTIKRQVIFL